MSGSRALAAARLAVTRASRVCRAVQREMRATGTARAIIKGDSSPVTIADFASQAVVAWTLREALGPGLTLVAEEGTERLRRPEHEADRGAALEAARLEWPGASEDDMLGAIDLGAGEPPPGGEPFWTLDPIDGTKGFLRGEQYAVCLALVERGAPIVAALGCPNLSPDFERSFDDADPRGLVFLSERAGGAWQAPADDERAPPSRVAPARTEPGAIRACHSVDAGHSDQSWSAQALARASAPATPAAPLRLDSQAKYAVVARGQADAYLRLPTRSKKDGAGPYVERIWDHAAGALIATETGRAVTDIDGKPLDFGRGRGLEANRGVVCAAPWAHASLVRAIADTRPG